VGSIPTFRTISSVMSTVDGMLDKREIQGQNLNGGPLPPLAHWLSAPSL
jgi:hypothetical protein